MKTAWLNADSSVVTEVDLCPAGFAADQGKILPAGEVLRVGNPPAHVPRSYSVEAVVVDKSEVFRAGLIQMLANADCRVVADRRSLAELAPQALEDCQCLLLGLDRDADGTLQAVVRLRDEHRDLRILLLAHDFDPEVVRGAVTAGGSGCLLKDEISSGLLLCSMELALLGGAIFSQGLLETMLENLLAPEPDALGASGHCEAVVPPFQSATAAHGGQIPAGYQLSAREHKILLQLMQGATNKQIARDLGISDATVKVHIKNLLRKIQARNRTQAAMWGISHL